MVRNQPIKFELIETRRGNALEVFIRTNPKISIRGYGQCDWFRFIEIEEVFPVEPSQESAIYGQPKKSIRGLSRLTDDHAGNSDVGGVMGNEEIRRRLV